VAPTTPWKYIGRKKNPESITKPWQKQTARAAMLERRWKIRRGIMAYLAIFHSVSKKRTPVKIPKMIKQITIAAAQGYDTPPNWRPRRSIMVPPTTVTEPDQSMAFRPSSIGVLGVLISRKTRRMMKANASIGTEWKMSIV
jgi:hypothetical protein